MLMETLACAPPSYLDAAGAGNHREKLSLPLFARFVTTFNRSVRSVDLPTWSRLTLEEWSLMQYSRSRRYDHENIALAKLYARSSPWNFANLENSSPGYIKIIYSGKSRCFSNVNCFHAHGNSYVIFLWMQSYQCSLFSKKIAHWKTCSFISAHLQTALEKETAFI